MQRFLLETLCLLSGYRFHNFLYPSLRVPYTAPGLNAKEIREKARASSAVAGLFLAFILALLAALAAVERIDAIDKLKPVTCDVVIAAIIGALLPYLALREQRKISSAHWEAKEWQRSKGKTHQERQKREAALRIAHRLLLVTWFVLYLLMFTIPSWQTLLSKSLVLSGLFIILGSLLFLISSVELYDTAGGLQKLENLEYHFHMSSLASHSYLLGFSMSLVGFCLLLCGAHLRTGFWLSIVTLAFLIAMTEIERELYNLAA